jgi:predicted PurR-regulated permease PerM
MLCELCCLATNRRRAGEIRFRLAVTTILLVGTTTLVGVQQHVPRSYALLAGAIVVCLYWGSKLVAPSSTADEVRDALHPVAGLIGGLFKVVLAGVVGVFAAPAGIALSVVELVQIRRTIRAIETQNGAAVAA